MSNIALRLLVHGIAITLQSTDAPAIMHGQVESMRYSNLVVLYTCIDVSHNIPGHKLSTLVCWSKKTTNCVTRASSVNSAHLILATIEAPWSSPCNCHSVQDAMKRYNILTLIPSVGMATWGVALESIIVEEVKFALLLLVLSTLSCVG